MLTAGQDYVIFLWTSKSGLTQVIGLSQGLFNVTTNAQGQTIVSRGAASSPMLDSSGQVVADFNLQMPLAQACQHHSGRAGRGRRAMITREAAGAG